MRGPVTFLLPAMLALVSSPAAATVIHVYADGTGDAPTIAAAYAMAAYGDVISVGPGTYHEHDIVMRSLVDLVSESNDAGDTIVDAQGLGRCLDGSAVTGRPSIRAITFRNGTHPVEGGLLLAGMGGTGGSHNAWYYDCVFQDGSAPRGGAVATRASGGQAPRFIRCVFERNEATVTDGGAVWTVGVGSASECVFRENASVRHGGAVCSERYGEWGFDSGGCTFRENVAGEDGGAFYSAGWGNFYGCAIQTCLFVGNRARDGGAARLEQYDIVQGCTFLDNEATRDGGALRLVEIDADEDYFGQYIGNVFARNRAGSTGGAFTLTGNPSWLRLEGCTFVANGAPSGGQIYATRPFSVNGCILAFATEGGAAAGSAPPLTTTCTDVFGNAAGDFVGPLAAAAANPSNFSLDPLFCAPASDELTLQEGSPCLPPLPAGCSGSRIGALGAGCGPTAVEPRSWGRIKAGYR
jgi:predicted outer membrane repeat protein